MWDSVPHFYVKAEKVKRISLVVNRDGAMANEIIKASNDTIEGLYSKVSGLIEHARSNVKTSVNTAEVYTSGI